MFYNILYNVLKYLKNCCKNDSEHAKIFWKHALECSKIVFEKVEKSWKKLKIGEKNEKMFLESSTIWCLQIMSWKKDLSSQKNNATEN